MKKAIVLLFLLLLASTAYAADLNACKDNNGFTAIGNCLMRGSFSGDGMFFSIIMIVIFAVFMFQARLPAGAVLGLSLIMFFALGPFMGNLYVTLLNLTIMAIGVLVGLAILHFVRR